LSFPERRGNGRARKGPESAARLNLVCNFCSIRWLGAFLTPQPPRV
jgi:hypothetical protein